MSSKVFSVVGKALIKLNKWYEASSAAKAFNKIWAFLGNAFCGSFIHRFFSPGKRKNIWENSIFGKIVNLPKNFILFLQKKLSAPISRMVANSKLCQGISDWANVSVRIYGIAALMIFQ